MRITNQGGKVQAAPTFVEIAKNFIAGKTNLFQDTKAAVALYRKLNRVAERNKMEEGARREMFKQVGATVDNLIRFGRNDPSKISKAGVQIIEKFSAKNLNSQNIKTEIRSAINDAALLLHANLTDDEINKKITELKSKFVELADDLSYLNGLNLSKLEKEYYSMDAMATAIEKKADKGDLKLWFFKPLFDQCEKLKNQLAEKGIVVGKNILLEDVK